MTKGNVFILSANPCDGFGICICSGGSKNAVGAGLKPAPTNYCNPANFMRYVNCAVNGSTVKRSAHCAEAPSSEETISAPW